MASSRIAVSRRSGRDTSPEYKAVHNTYFHHATILKRGKVIASSRNKIGTRSRGCGWSTCTLHAERAVVKSLGDISQLRGCVLVVVRVSHEGIIRDSEPCSDCAKFLTKCMDMYGLRRVEYSSTSDSD